MASRTIFRYHQDSVSPATARKRYLMLDFEPGEEGASSLDVPLSLGDLSDLLTLPSQKSRLRRGAGPLVQDYLKVEQALLYARSVGLDMRDIFFNAVPLIVNAGIAIYPHIKDKIGLDSIESRYFDFHFREVIPFNTSRHMYDVFEFWRPERA